MATSEKLQHEFVIGNRSQELFEIVISVCDPRKDNSRFPAYVRTELGGGLLPRLETARK